MYGCVCVCVLVAVRECINVAGRRILRGCASYASFKGKDAMGRLCHAALHYCIDDMLRALPCIVAVMVIGKGK